MGCNIDNNRGKVIVGTECGKVVNLLVLEATKEDNQVRICVMNTHMSFDGDSQMRMNYIEQALDEADKAGCEAVVFVGDFNTRLHCQAPDRKASRPANANPLEYVLELFKKPKGEGARLDGEHVFVDELAHMISNPEVTCFDKKVSGSWKLGNYNSTLYKRGIVESKVTFGPTYKMYPRAEAEGLKFHKCFAGMKMCYGNSDGADKHNPAWTDRVLAKGPVKQVDNYQSLEIPPGMKSDHLPVSATVWIDVHRKVHFNHLGKIPMKPPPKLFKGMNPAVTRSISAPVGSHDDT
jgi:hypothetical protein